MSRSRTMRAALSALALAATTFAAACAHAETYALDDAPRPWPSAKEKVTCATEDMVAYRGTNVRYEVPATVHPAFRARLERFEAVARDVGIEVYGRPPKLLHHAGAYACRKTERGRVSEHAFGNAIDLEGFSFAPLAKADAARLAERGVTLPAKEKRAVRLHVGDAWSAHGSAESKRFFTLLLARLRESGDVFRAIIGPPAAGHATHLHLDAGPWAFDRYELPASS